jgi:anti-anti-sigma factor
LDLQNVRFLTSTFLAGLLTLRRLLKAAGGQLALTNVNPLLYEVLEATCLTQVFEVHREGEAG